MAENFKKHRGGPTPAAAKGDPADPKRVGTSPSHHPHSQDPKLAKHKGRPTAHEPPNTPHHPTKQSSLMSPVSTSREIRQAQGTPHILKHQAAENAINPNAGTSQPHRTVQGTRYPSSGGQKDRPYHGMGMGGPADIGYVPTGQQHHMAGPARHAYRVGMTKNVRGRIGKAKKKHAVSRYP